jgi:hypothetical protein
MLANLTRTLGGRAKLLAVAPRTIQAALSDFRQLRGIDRAVFFALLAETTNPLIVMDGRQPRINPDYKGAPALGRDAEAAP